MATALVAAFASQFIRQASIQPGAFKSIATFLLSFTDSKENQWMTVICVGGYAIFYIACVVVLWGGNSGEKSGKLFHLLWRPETLILAFLGIGTFIYAADYATAYSKSDFLTLLAGITAGQAVLWLSAWRRAERLPNALHEEMVTLFLVILTVAAVFHPYMGRSFQYRDETRWMGPFFNPNTYGSLMGLGLILAFGQMLQRLLFDQRDNARKAGRMISFPTGRGPRLELLIYVAVLLLLGNGLIKSYSRAAWFASACACGYLLYTLIILLTRQARSSESSPLNMANPGPASVTHGSLRYVPAVMILVISLFVLAFWNLRHTEQRVIRRAFSVANFNDFSWRNRATTSIGSLQMMADKPFGFGWNRVQDSYDSFYRPATLFEGYAVTLNDYLVLGISLGLPALACFLLYIASKFIRGHQDLKMGRDAPPLSGVWSMAVCRAGAIVPLLSFVPQRGIFYIALATPFWVLLVLGAERPSVVRKEVGNRGNIDPIWTRALGIGRCVLKYRAFAVALLLFVLGGTGYLLLRSLYDPSTRDPQYQQILAGFHSAYPSAVSVSPNGQYVLHKTEERNGFRISIQDKNDARVVASNFSESSQRALTWRPDSQAIVFQEIDGMDRPLYLFDLETAEKRKLDVPVSRTALPPLRWNSTWNTLAYFYGNWNNGRLLAIDMEQSDEPLELVESMSGTCDFEWSPDDKHIASISASRPGVISITSVDTLKSREIQVVEGGKVQSLAWSPDGNSILVAARGNSHDYAMLFEVDSVIGTSSNSLLLRAEETGDISNPVWHPDGKSFLYHVLTDGIIHATLMDRNGLSKRVIGPTNGVLRVTHFNPDGTALYGRFASITAPPCLIEVPLTQSEMSVLYTPPQSVAVTCPEPQSLRIPSFDDVKIPAYHWRSQEADAPPSGLLIEVHGGLHTQTFPTWEPTISTLLKHGIDVITVNYRGSSGYGQAFEKMGNDFERVQDVLAARNYAVNVLKVDPKKIYLMGNSRGSSLVAAAAAHGEEIGGLVLISWAGPMRDVDLQLSKEFTILGFQGVLDPFVPPANAKASIEGFFAPSKNVKIQSRWHSFKNEGHFFYESESWAKICWEIVRLNQSE